MNVLGSFCKAAGHKIFYITEEDITHLTKQG
jgi:hypothetical protein